MSDINAVAAEISSAFSLPEGAVKVQRATRLWVEVDRAVFPALFEKLVKSMGFSMLCTITGLDLGPDLGLIYHLARDGGIVANVKTKCPKGDSIRTVTPLFPARRSTSASSLTCSARGSKGSPRGGATRCPKTGPRTSTPS